jgi:hypothetical protein
MRERKRGPYKPLTFALLVVEQFNRVAINFSAEQVRHQRIVRAGFKARKIWFTGRLLPMHEKIAHTKLRAGTAVAVVHGRRRARTRRRAQQNVYKRENSNEPL